MKTAREFLDQCFVIDTHLDLLADLDNKHAAGRTDVILNDYYEDMKKGGVDTVVAAVYIDEGYLPESGLKKIMDQISALYQELDRSEGRLALVKSTADIRRARENGQLGILLSMEGVEPLNGHVSHLRTMYELGVRIVSLCWSRSGWACDGSRFFDYDYQGYGLTEKGADLVRYAQELGMLMDVTHANEQSFWDILNMSKEPVIATHSDTRRYSDTPRNLSDEQIRALGQTGGVVGVNGVSLVACVHDPLSANMDTLVDHIEHEISLTSPSIACIGLDQCSRIMGEVASTGVGELSTMFDVIPSHAMLEQFTEALIQRGLSEETIEGILGKNVLRLLERVIG